MVEQDVRHRRAVQPEQMSTRFYGVPYFGGFEAIIRILLLEGKARKVTGVRLHFLDDLAADSMPWSFATAAKKTRGGGGGRQSRVQAPSSS